MRIIKKFKRVTFGIHEAIWWIVAEIEDWLYPYRDSEVKEPLWASQSIDVDDLSEIRSQQAAANDRIDRLQSEMIHVLSTLNEHKNKLREIDGQK